MLWLPVGLWMKSYAKTDTGAQLLLKGLLKLEVNWESLSKIMDHAPWEDKLPPNVEMS